MLFKTIPLEECQRVQNELRIYTRPMFLFSEQPDGRSADDPFEYHSGGKYVKTI